MTTKLISVELRSDLLTTRQHAKIMRDVNREIMERHRRLILRRHFEGTPETRAGGAWDYAPRSLKYNRWKKRKVGHTIPLVLTGKLKQIVLTQSKITATQHRSRLYVRGYFPMKPELRDEIEAVSSQDAAALVKWAKKEYIDRANDPANRRKRRRKATP